MKVSIDSAGRLVVPKKLRDELNLVPGTRLEITVRNGKLELEPAAARMRLIRRGGGMVATSDEPLPRLNADEVRAVVDSLRR